MKPSRSYILRILILAGICLTYYAVLIGRLWQEQVKQGREHREAVQKQSIRQIRLPSVRGRIYSSDGTVLADNAPAYNAVFHLAEMRQPGVRQKTLDYIMAEANRLGQKIGRQNPLSHEKIISHINTRPALPLTVFADLNIRELARTAELSPEISGMEISTHAIRIYPKGSLACHVIGYVGRDDPSTASDRDEFFYYIPDLVGRAGLERFYDLDIAAGRRTLRGLRGIPGQSLVRVDFRGYVYETIGDPTPPQDGLDIVLTLDWRAQSIAESLFTDKRGAFVLLDADTGAIIAMVSSPGFNLQRFSPYLPASYWQQINSDPAHPMLNRACRGQYTPGSIAKAMVAIAILEAGHSPLEEINCPGRSYIGNTSIRCWSWQSGGHGRTALLEAIEQSCNVYFIEQAKLVGMEKITATMQQFGIGSKTGIPLPENSGLLPTREDQQRIHKQKWTTFDTALMSIGQGIILLTPIQAARYAAAITNGGKLCQPYLLSEVRDSQENTLFLNPAPTPEETGINPQFLRLVKEGMYRVVHGERGSAKAAQTESIALFGKTGTAEIGPRNNRRKNTWFIGFGQHQRRNYAFSVFVEDGASGGRTSAPIAAEFFTRWLDQNQEL